MKVSDKKQMEEIERKLKQIEIKTANIRDYTTDAEIIKAVRQATDGISMLDIIYATDGIDDKCLPLNIRGTQGDIAKELNIGQQRVNNAVHNNMENISTERVKKGHITFCRFAVRFNNSKKAKFLLCEVSDIIHKDSKALKKAIELQLDRAEKMGVFTKVKAGYKYNEKQYKEIGRRTAAYPHENDIKTWHCILKAIAELK